ncbi:MAG TPA: 4-hydroxythreonine-4-phosphate dehydrogenase PdxA [Steroidobacteraceae bacterium]|nr:4-hydroxythreonine-4-phosphate dehydrogenase PdxA [Steroidobacteraceae bacterium]
MRARPRLVLTAGEPAGIGPDLCIMLGAQLQAQPADFDLVCLADESLLRERAAKLGITLDPGAHFSIRHQSLTAPVTAGKLDPRNARWVLGLLDTALQGCRSGEYDAMVTAPVQKSVINDAGIAFTGHTEYLAEHCGVARPVMLLAAGSLRVALATTHLPLTAVSGAITAAALDEILQVIHADLSDKWGIAAPRIGVCGLNPHAGESGHLGREEIDVIAPAIARAVARGIRATGPWPADTIFTPRQLAHFDVVLAMYHDQGLPVLKHAGFGEAVNITLGLPILRTSVDHGTALDLAATGRAEPGSLHAAIALAAELARGRLTRS